MPQEISIIDYGMGNLNSVKRKFSLIGIKANITSDPSIVINSEKIVLPGVGHFQKAVENLKELRLWDALNEAVLVKRIPILGICLGMQLMARHSEEGDVDGFGWFDADVVRFRVKEYLTHKVPHTGWNKILRMKESLLMTDIPDLSEFYFVHTFHFRCNTPSDILNETEYEYKFTSAVEKENIYGVQYHPEKSHDVGEQLMKNFTKI
jgi:imidazole glycerol-phosphate synthase subunit HisH